MNKCNSVSMTGLFERYLHLGTLPNYYQIGNNDCVNVDSNLVTWSLSRNSNTPLNMAVTEPLFTELGKGCLNSFVIVKDACTKFHENRGICLVVDTRSQTGDCRVQISCFPYFISYTIPKSSTFFTHLSLSPTQLDFLPSLKSCQLYFFNISHELCCWNW
jgi:hypothetical protein